MATVAEYNNNPGNIRPPKGVAYKGQIGVDDRGFAIFESYDYGRDALINDIKIKQKRGINNPHAFIDVYTPASEENPEQARDNYKIGMAEHLGLKNTSDPFPENSAEKIAEFIEKFEGGKQTQGAQQKDNPNNPFAVGVPLADKAREDSKIEEVIEPSESSGDGIDPAKAALAGAAANLFLPMFTNPQVSPKVDTSRAVEANLSAQDKLELARRNFQEAAPQGMYNLEETYRQNQMELERLKNEQRSAQERLRGLPRNAPTIESSTPSVSDEVPSRTKAGASGASNWVRAMGEDVPDVLADQAANMRKDNPRGGQAIIDRDMAARQRQADLGLGDYSLTRTEGGVQLALPPTTVAERQAEIERQNQANQAELERKAYEAKIQQDTQNWIAEQQRLAHEEQLERLRQERAAAGERQNILSSQKKSVAPLQRALTKAEMDAEIAQRKLARANQQPNAAGRVLEKTGVASTKMGAIPRTVVGGGLSYLGVMSYQDALERFKAGDTSEGVLSALQAGSSAAAMLPPAGKALTKTRGAGTLGALTLGGYQLGKRLLKERPDE
jgi:hypothetical protein